MLAIAVAMAVTTFALSKVDRERACDAELDPEKRGRQTIRSSTSGWAWTFSTAATT